MRKGNQVLLGRKAPGVGPYADTWHTPGGGVNLVQETCEEALVREVREETGLEVTNLKKVAWDTDIEPNKQGELTYYVFLAYTCDYTSGDIKPADDIQQLKWVDVDKLGSYALNRASLALYRQLGYIT